VQRSKAIVAGRHFPHDPLLTHIVRNSRRHNPAFAALTSAWRWLQGQLVAMAMAMAMLVMPRIGSSHHKSR